MVEHRILTPKVAGSSPVGGSSLGWFHPCFKVRILGGAPICPEWMVRIVVRFDSLHRLLIRHFGEHDVYTKMNWITRSHPHYLLHG